MRRKIKSAVMASFVADALALGVHWVYNTHAIDRKFGRIETYEDPMTSFHEGKSSGDFTHYGDQTMVLLRSVSDNGGFDSRHFMASWRAFFSDYKGYFDQATKATLANLEQGMDPETAGSGSDDLGGASRIAPLFLYYAEDSEKMVQFAREQTGLTHNHLHVIDAAEFFARTTREVLSGKKPSDAVRQIGKEFFDRPPFKEWVNDGLDSVGQNTRTVISDFGQMCAVEAAFPSVIHLIGKYETDLKNALVENCMAGGDSAARGMLAGLVLGSFPDAGAVPEPWLKGLHAKEEISRLLGG